jgi:hypothetical protein
MCRPGDDVTAQLIYGLIEEIAERRALGADAAFVEHVAEEVAGPGPAHPEAA